MHWSPAQSDMVMVQGLRLTVHGTHDAGIVDVRGLRSVFWGPSKEFPGG